MSAMSSACGITTATPSVGAISKQLEKFDLQERRPLIVVAMSVGNPFFYKEENLTRLLQYADTHADKVKLFITDIIAEHNYRALGNSHPKRAARLNANALRNKCNRSINKLPDLDPSKVSYVDWMTEVETFEHYKEQLNYITVLFKCHQEFQSEVRRVTNMALTSLCKGRKCCVKKNEPEANVKAQGEHGKMVNSPDSTSDQGHETKKNSVLSNKMGERPSENSQAVSADSDIRADFDIMEGVNYILKELAFILAVPQIYDGFDRFVFVYHKPWPIMENLLSGVYDDCVRKEIVFVVVE